MKNQIKEKLILFDQSFNLDNNYNYSLFLSSLFKVPTINIIHRLIELYGLGRTSSSINNNIFHYIPLLWRLLFGCFLIYGWIHFCFLRPGINIVVQLPIYSTPIAAFIFGPYTVIWSESHLVASEITICAKEVLNESGWIFTVLPIFVTSYQFIAFMIFRDIGNSFHFYGSQASKYFPNETFFILYYSLFWFISGLLLAFVVSNIIIWMKIHEKQLKLFRSYMLSNSNNILTPNEKFRTKSALFDIESNFNQRSTINGGNPLTIIELRQSEFFSTESPNNVNPLRNDINSNINEEFSFLLRPEILMKSHETFRKSVMQSSTCCSIFVLLLTVFSTANYFFLLLVIRKNPELLDYWTFLRVILWLILTLLVLTSAARVTQSWHQMSIAISSIKIMITSSFISSISPYLLNNGLSNSNNSNNNNNNNLIENYELSKRQWDELIIYLDHVRHGTGYNYKFAAISITPSLIAKSCVALIYATYLIVYGLG